MPPGQPTESLCYAKGNYGMHRYSTYINDPECAGGFNDSKMRVRCDCGDQIVIHLIGGKWSVTK